MLPRPRPAAGNHAHGSPGPAPRRQRPHCPRRARDTGPQTPGSPHPGSAQWETAGGVQPDRPSARARCPRGQSRVRGGVLQHEEREAAPGDRPGPPVPGPGQGPVDSRGRRGWEGTFTHTHMHVRVQEQAPRSTTPFALPVPKERDAAPCRAAPRVDTAARGPRVTFVHVCVTWMTDVRRRLSSPGSCTRPHVPGQPHACHFTLYDRLCVFLRWLKNMK